jgi:hypothetical protein
MVNNSEKFATRLEDPTSEAAQAPIRRYILSFMAAKRDLDMRSPTPYIISISKLLIVYIGCGLA